MRTLALASVASLLLACSNNPGTGDGGTDSGGGDSSSGFTQTGQIVGFGGGNGIPGVTVTAAGSSTTTDTNGKYTLTVPGNTAYSMQASDQDAGYVTLDEQEWMLLGNADRGKTSFVPGYLEQALQGALPSTPVANLAVLSVIVEATGACTPDAGGSDVTGATISVPGLVSGDAGADASTGGPVIVYFSGGFPSGTATSVTAGQVPSALVYNLPTAAAFNQVTVTHPTCKQASFPIADPSAPNIQYTGNVKLEASQPSTGTYLVSNIRVFLQ